MDNEKNFRRVRFEDSQRLDKEYWATKTPQERFDALKVIMALVVKIHPVYHQHGRVFQRVYRKTKHQSC